MNNNANYSYSGGVKPYEYNDPFQRSPPAHYNMTSFGNGNNFHETSRNSPCETSRLVCPSTSPSSSSSGGSSSSHCYGQSPGGSVDSLIAGILQIVDRTGINSPYKLKSSFTESDAHMLHRYLTHGAIIDNYPGPIDDYRIFRGRATPPHSMGSTYRQSKVIGRFLVPIGRPIPGNPYPVIVRNTCDLQDIHVIGNDGIYEDNLCRPWGITCDKDGNIIVADRSNNRIQIYRENGCFVRRFGTQGTGPGQFDRPAGVAVDERRRIIVADKDNHRIQILTMDGHFICTFGEKGSQVGQFNYPWDVATNSECQIVVSDTRNHRVQLFSPDGIFLCKYGYENISNMLKHFDSPRGVAFNPDGSIVMTDFNNHRLVVITPDFTRAKVLECDTSSGNKPFLRPQGLVVDDNGNIIVADSKNHRIQVLDSAGNLKWTFGTLGQNNGEMDRPSGIALTTSGRIAVVDFGNNRVLII